MSPLQNPYASPLPQSDQPAIPPDSLLAKIGLALSLTGFMAVFAVEMFGDWITMIAMYAAFLALPGFVMSAVAQLLRPSSLARLGIVLGIFGMFFLPTFYLSLRR